MEVKQDETSSSSASMDYKAELARLKSESEAKDRELDQAKFKLKIANIEKKKSSKVFDNEDSDDESTASNEEIVRQEVQKELAKTRSEDFLSKHSMDADEIELAKFHLENTIKPSGNAEADAIAALSIANRNTILKQKEELKTALANKSQANQTSMIPSSETKIEVNEFSKYLTPEQLTNLRTVQRFNDDQIRMFLRKKLGQK